MYPNAPNVEGLPLWLQLLVSIPFVLATMYAAVLGYRKKIEREPPGAQQTVVAAFPDMGAIRQLTDTCRILCSEVESLNASFRDHTHYLRNKIDTDQELCMRLRELKEEIVRSDKQRSQRP